MKRYQIKCGLKVERLDTYDRAVALARAWVELYRQPVILSDTKKLFQSTTIQKEQ